MKRSTGPRKTADLSKALHRQLNSYALAASAAGVGMIAIAQPAEGRIIYKETHTKILQSSTYLVLNGMGMPNFELKNSWYSGGAGSDFKARLVVDAVSQKGFVETSASDYRSVAAVAALRPGTKIPTVKNGLKNGGQLLFFFSNDGNTERQGKWWNARDLYLGMKFQTGGKTHFGWARISSHYSRFCAGILTGYAYETIPGKPIIAGRTEGQSAAAVQSAGLGHLARGAATMQPSYEKRNGGN